MNHRQILQTVTQIATIVEGAGGKLPKPLADGFARITATVYKVDHVDAGARLDLAKAVADALEADTDPATDPAVQAAAVRRAFSNCGLAEELDRRAHLFINAHAEALLSTLYKPFEKAAEVLAQAHEDLGDVDLDDTGAVLSRGGTAARSWAIAQEADAALDRIHQAFGALGLAARSVRFDPQWRLLMIADVPPAVMLDEHLRGTTIRPWDVLRRGWQLSLATPATLAERITAVHDEQARRGNAGATAFADKMRRTHPPIAVGSR